MSDHIRALQKVVNHRLHWSVVLLCGGVSQRRPWSVCLSISSCFTVSFAAVANKSSDLLPAFSQPLSQRGSCLWLCLSSLRLSSFTSLTESFHTLCFPLFLPVSCFNSLPLFHNTTGTLQTSLLPVSHPLLLSFPVPGVNQFGQQHMLQQLLS